MGGVLILGTASVAGAQEAPPNYVAAFVGTTALRAGHSRVSKPT